ncbi:MAG: hypothetical protein QXV10_06210, partial [Nitrososphaerota archaeon]
MIAFLLDTFIWIALYSILALSLSIEYGFTGIVNFGKALFFMIGAYVSAIVTLNGLKNLMKEIFPYNEVPKIDFDHKLLPLDPPE